MKLKNVQHGRMVINDKRVGMIKGITNNSPYSDVNVRQEIERVVVKVRWSDGHESAIHPANIEYLT